MALGHQRVSGVPSTPWAYSMALGCVSVCLLPSSAFNLQPRQASLLAALSLTPHPQLEADDLFSSVNCSVVPLFLRSDHVGPGGGAEEGDG